MVETVSVEQERSTTGCKHERFGAKVDVARLEDVGRFMAEVRVWCTQCGRKFQFLGLPPGVDTGGARVSVDGLEANIAICPEGETPSPLGRISAHFAPDMKRRH